MEVRNVLTWKPGNAIAQSHIASQSPSFSRDLLSYVYMYLFCSTFWEGKGLGWNSISCEVLYILARRGQTSSEAIHNPLLIDMTVIMVMSCYHGEIILSLCWSRLVVMVISCYLGEVILLPWWNHLVIVVRSSDYSEIPDSCVIIVFSQIMTRCTHLLSAADPRLRLLVLDTVCQACLALRDYQGIGSGTVCHFVCYTVWYIVCYSVCYIVCFYTHWWLAGIQKLRQCIKIKGCPLPFSQMSCCPWFTKCGLLLRSVSLMRRF